MAVLPAVFAALLGILSLGVSCDGDILKAWERPWRATAKIIFHPFISGQRKSEGNFFTLAKNVSENDMSVNVKAMRLPSRNKGYFFRSENSLGGCADGEIARLSRLEIYNRLSGFGYPWKHGAVRHGEWQYVQFSESLDAAGRRLPVIFHNHLHEWYVLPVPADTLNAYGNVSAQLEPSLDLGLCDGLFRFSSSGSSGPGSEGGGKGRNRADNGHPDIDGDLPFSRVGHAPLLAEVFRVTPWAIASLPFLLGVLYGLSRFYSGIWSRRWGWCFGGVAISCGCLCGALSCVSLVVYGSPLMFWGLG